ncbi:hypothetical protein PTTG_12146 [Puccinia triticina 1-1 BBBD Race 1]|uniref:Uncharacterized protein n=2 Tax=Puccinia triticina TaxID=208348 RepID=A0A180GFA4_PUCT1|nr:uncharacterized protein PtA15_16A180 [Puccinia triticina]OAV91128.1 hypothetical protein PTTG_12146 [Puccinia triticina 1-1 BBBD Race 1]WAQ92274.1 hypothetical protein PtA15_16A180 [Puccinia triticina]
MSQNGRGRPINRGGLSNRMEENRRRATGQQHLHTTMHLGFPSSRNSLALPSNTNYRPGSLNNSIPSETNRDSRSNTFPSVDNCNLAAQPWIPTNPTQPNHIQHLSRHIPVPFRPNSQTIHRDVSYASQMASSNKHPLPHHPNQRSSIASGGVAIMPPLFTSDQTQPLFPNTLPTAHSNRHILSPCPTTNQTPNNVFSHHSNHQDRLLSHRSQPASPSYQGRTMPHHRSQTSNAPLKHQFHPIPRSARISLPSISCPPTLKPISCRFSRKCSSKFLSRFAKQRK